MGKLFHSLIRASSFFQKEVSDVLRQPRLIGTLVLGPFLILFLFGLGYRSHSPALRTLFVVPPNSSISAEEVQKSAKALDYLLEFDGTTSNQAEALNQLKEGKVDLVIIEPDNAENTIKNNQQAVIRIYHHEIDPGQITYIMEVGGIYVDAVNREVLRAFAVQAQKDATNLHTNLQEAHQNVLDMRQALKNGQAAQASQKGQALSSNVSTFYQTAGPLLSFYDSMQPAGGPGESNTDPLAATMDDMRQNVKTLGDASATPDQRLTSLEKTDKDIANLDNQLAEYQKMDPSIMIAPFTIDTKSAENINATVNDYISPAVLALLLQHMAVTFAALSIVRERNVGTMELFRVSPLSAAEALFGKYVSYMLFGSIIATILSALLAFVLHMPMLGNWWYFALVIVVELFASLGIGFAISIVSQTDSQAVQYSMIVLLASVFFSGFIMNLELFWPSVKVVSWMLPATYGAYLLRDIGLRGVDPNWPVLGGLFAIGLGLMFLSWGLMRRLIAAPR